MTRKCKLGFVSKNILRNLQLHFKTVVMFRRNFRHTRGKATRATHTVVEFAKNSAKPTKK